MIQQTVKSKLESRNSTEPDRATERPDAIYRRSVRAARRARPVIQQTLNFRLQTLNSPAAHKPRVAVSSGFKRYLAAKKIIFGVIPLLRGHFPSAQTRKNHGERDVSVGSVPRRRTCRTVFNFSQTVRLPCKLLRRKSSDTVRTTPLLMNLLVGAAFPLVLELDLALPPSPHSTLHIRHWEGPCDKSLSPSLSGKPGCPLNPLSRQGFGSFALSQPRKKTENRHVNGWFWGVFGAAQIPFSCSYS